MSKGEGDILAFVGLGVVRELNRRTVVGVAHGGSGRGKRGKSCFARDWSRKSALLSTF